MNAAGHDSRPAPVRVAVIGLGGTISSTSTSPQSGFTPTLDMKSLAGSLGVTGIAVETHDIAVLPSPALTFDHLMAVGSLMADLGSHGVNAFVISQGADTIEETSYLLDLLGYGAGRSVVVTGAMRTASSPGPDGPANLVASIVAAASADLVDIGVVVCFGQRVHAARWVSKTGSNTIDPFSSAPLGPLGAVVEDELRIESFPRRRPPLDRVLGSVSARVALITAGLDDNLEYLESLAGSGLDALVIAGMGGGHVPPAAVPVVERLGRSMPVVVASRTPTGPTLRRTYSYPGGEIDLAQRGVINGGSLTPIKCRLLLACLISTGLSGDALAAEFGRLSS